jgi:hypothetical protein
MANSTQIVSTQEIAASTTPFVLQPVQDNDSMLAASASISLSPSGTDAFQFNGNVSSPTGDTEDWLQFTSVGSNIIVEVKCSTDTLHVELWNNGLNVEGEIFSCGQTRELGIKSGETYFLRVLANESNIPQVTQYSLTLKNAR